MITSCPAIYDQALMMHQHYTALTLPRTNPRFGPKIAPHRAALAAMVALVLMFVAASLASAPVEAYAPTTVTVNPTEHYRLIQTPGSGFQDFVGLMPSSADLQSCNLEGGQTTASDQAGLKGGSIYLRLLWRDIEPAEGQYRWPEIDQIFICAKQQNKTIDFRLMLSYPEKGDTDCIDGGHEDDTVTHGIPCWLVRKGVSELFYSGTQERAIAPNTYLPDWEDATLRQAHAELIWAFANRYGSNPSLSTIDIGSAGLWGEWHTFPDNTLMPSNRRATEIIDLYAAAFPDTPLVVLAEVFKNDLAGNSAVADHLRTSHAGRYGWRGDSWGGLGHHTQDYTPIHAANPDLWKTGPVALEVTGIMNEWPARQDGSGSYGSVVPIGRAATDALAWHTTLAHNKASNIPSSFVESLQWMDTQVGPRLVLQELIYPSSVSAGTHLVVSTEWHNRGVAPLYRDFRTAFRFTNAGGESHTVTTSQSAKGLLPTQDTAVATNIKVAIPSSMQAGAWTLEVGVVFHSDASLRIPLAITSPDDNDWYHMGSIEVITADPAASVAKKIRSRRCSANTALELRAAILTRWLRCLSSMATP